MRVLFRRSLLAAATGAALTFGAVQAQTETKVPAQTRFDLPRQPLDEAIREIARLAGINIVIDSRLVKGLEIPGLKIRATPEDALKRLLEGTGLAPLYVDAHTVTILSEDHARAVQSAAQKQEGTDRPFGLAQADTTRSDPSPLDPPIRREIFELEDLEIVVTGTRIRGANSSASPTYSFDREDFAAAGATSVQQMMQTLPQNFTGGNSETSGALASARNGAAANIAFGAGLNLRGLGNASTLVLLNGRRMAPAGLGGFVDVSTIPLSALERIDVVPDATSAVYGSDAVGGVVNFILRSDYQGAETSVRYGSVTDGGMREFTVTQLVGTTWASGSILLNVDYGSREPLLASERAYSPGLSQEGQTYLTPSEDRIGVLVNGRQTLADELTLKAVAYVNTRNADVQSFMNSVGRQLTSQGDTDQAGGTIDLAWETGRSWAITLAQTMSHIDTERANLVGPSVTASAMPSSVSADQGMSMTQLDAEGVLFGAPGGAVRLALGAEHRREDLEEIRAPGAFSEREISNFERTLHSGYAEVFVPLVGDANRKSWARRVDLTAAVRYEDYDDVGAADTYKLGTLWSPIEGFNLRATYGTSFRAPYLYQFQTSLGFVYLLPVPNPAAPSGSTLIAIIAQLPEPNLGPEVATTWSAGFDIEPHLLAGFRVRSTYFRINYEDRISATAGTLTPFDNADLAGAISMPPDPEVMAQIGTLPPSMIFQLGTTAPWSAAEATLDGRTRNQARTKVSGLDLLIDRDFDFGAAHLKVGANASYLFLFEEQMLRNSAIVDRVDTVFNPVDLRFRAHATYSSGAWSVSTFVNHTDDYTDNQATPFVRVSDWTTVDLAASYTFGRSRGWLDGVTLHMNAINVLDEAPPLIIDRAPSWGNPGFDTENANPLGRVLSVQVSKQW